MYEWAGATVNIVRLGRRAPGVVQAFGGGGLLSDFAIGFPPIAH